MDGSVEAILSTISTYNSQQCHLNILKYDVGIVSEQDVESTATFNGMYNHIDTSEIHQNNFMWLNDMVL